MDEGAALAVEAGGVISWLEELQSMAAVDRPGMDLMGGGRRGSCFIPGGLWKVGRKRKTLVFGQVSR